jgi:hypothetical protein
LILDYIKTIPTRGLLKKLARTSQASSALSAFFSSHVRHYCLFLKQRASVFITGSYYSLETAIL